MTKAHRWLRPAVVLGTLVSTPLMASAGPRWHRDVDENQLSRLTDALQQDGFEVSRGATAVFNPVAEWCKGGDPTGLGHVAYANYQPYLQLLVPESASKPDQMVGPFKLGPAEAIVLIGLTPPPEKYFGFYSFLRTRVDADGVRQSLWATLGDAVNNATIHTGGPTPFNTAVVLIFTPDRETDARVRAGLRRAGYPAAIINTVTIPASMLHLGHGDAADQLFLVMRNAIWQDDAEGAAYVAAPPLRLLRVTPRTEPLASPFPAPRLRVRGTGQTEMDLMNTVGQLRQAIVDANPGLHPQDVTMQVVAYEGYDFIQRGVDPWGDARDTIFLTGGWVPEFGATDELTLADDEFLMIYGTNHAATGKAAYHSVSFYSSNEGKVPLGGVDDRVFTGTAAAYLPNDPAAANLLYAYKVARDCKEEPACLELGIQDCPRLTVGPTTVLSVWARMYLEAATKVGPAMSEILYDRVLKFSPRPQ